MYKTRAHLQMVRISQSICRTTFLTFRKMRFLIQQENKEYYLKLSKTRSVQDSYQVCLSMVLLTKSKSQHLRVNHHLSQKKEQSVVMMVKQQTNRLVCLRTGDLIRISKKLERPAGMMRARNYQTADQCHKMKLAKTEKKK